MRASVRASRAARVCTTLLALAFPASSAEIERQLPPAGTHVPAEEVLSQQASRMAALAAETVEHPRFADAAIYVEAARRAHQHGEFYGEKAASYVDEALATAAARFAALKDGKTPWLTGAALVTCGFRSALDDSIQPYGLEIPQSLELEKPVPLYVWLHGRGDKNTDLYFLRDREKKRSPFAFEDGITLHPFGRQCVGFKSAGEIDVLEAVADVKQRYHIDSHRVVLLGFSMGGAGAWHLGAHYADQWAAVHAGAGFAETAQYNKLSSETYPPLYEQTLWSIYDVPNYARNLLNQPLLAYSGENDKQMQAALVMEAALKQVDHSLRHIIGPGMGHKYHDHSIVEIKAWLKEALAHASTPKTSWHWQTRTLRYPGYGPWRITGLVEHYQDSRFDVHVAKPGAVDVTTSNVSALETDLAEVRIRLDGQVMPTGQPNRFVRDEKGQWSRAALSGLRKRPGLQGPIDDAFMAPFLEVSGGPLEEWQSFEQRHFHERWSAVFRGEVRSKPAEHLTKKDTTDYHLLYWGTPMTNPAIERLMQDHPIVWNAQEIRIGDRSWPSAHHVLLMIYPNPDQPDRYLVVNSGPTFREAHDKTNSQQNPKLGDWAVIDTRVPPNTAAAGKVVASGFFGERWEIKP